MSDGQESRGDIPYELGHCACDHLEAMHAISETTGKRTACSSWNCQCRRFVAAAKGPEEALLTLSLPLDARLVAELLKGIAEGARRAGYTDVAMLTDGSNQIVGRRFVAAQEVASRG